jgi:hypothetical protein
VLGLPAGSWDADLRVYGYNAILGDLEPSPPVLREVGVMLIVSAADQRTARPVRAPSSAGSTAACSRRSASAA